MPERLPTLLNHYYHDTLLRIAESNGLPILDPAGHRLRKEVLINMLCKRVYTPEAARAGLAQLTPLERTVLDRILLCGGEVQTYILRDELQREGIVQSRPADGVVEGQRRDQPGTAQAHFFEDVIAELTLRGLVLSEDHPQSWNSSAKLALDPGLRLIVPEPVRNGLPRPAWPAVEWGSATLPAPPAETTVALAQRDLFIYWSHARTQGIPVTQLGLVQKRTLRALNEQLILPDPALATAANELKSPRLHFLRLLLQGLQLLQHEGKWITAEQGGHIPQFWDKSVEERTNACLRVWVHLADWSELSSLGMSSFDLDLQRARALLLDHLRLLEPGIWISADRFLSRLFMAVSHLLFKSRDAHPSSAYFYEGHLAPQNGSQRLAEVEGTFVGGALSGPLHWMGIVDIAADGSRLLAFRLNSSGALALGIKGPGSATPAHLANSTQNVGAPGSGGAGEIQEARLIVQPNFQVFAWGPVSEGTLARVELFADRVKADRSAVEYALSHAAVYRGQRAGLSVDQIIAFLEQTSGAALPQNVLRTLQEWGEQHERIVFHRAVGLCQTGTPEMLNELSDEPAIRSCLQKRLTPTVALLKRGCAHPLRETLLQHGFLPALSTQTDRCAGRLQAAPDGELAPVHEGPDLLLESCLQSLAEEREGQFYITEDAVHRATATGLGIREYLGQLNELHRGALPAALQMRIKAWGRYYGKASLQQAMLLEVKDSAMADELMEDAELAPLLSRFAADPRGRLLLVDADDLERLQHLLDERGIEVTRKP